MRSILARLMLMSVTTAVLTTSLAAGILHTQPQPAVGETGSVSAQRVLGDVVQAWQLGGPLETYTNAPMQSVRGYIVSQDSSILFTYGDTPCTAGMSIAICYPNIDILGTTGRAQRHADDHITWTDAKQALHMGGWAVVSYRNLTVLSAPSIWANVVLQVGLITLLAFPISFLLSLVTARPLARRLKRIAQVSGELARGNLAVRTGETSPDEIGQLGTNFDQMALVLHQQVDALRHLAEENSALLLVAEQAARAAERSMLSRDLHDAISQHLFSLAMGTSNLATVIRRNPQSAVQNAEQLALIAEQAQDELREVLHNLRPITLNSGNLVDALSEWITAWQTRYAIETSMQCSLGNGPLPLLVEEVLFRACQEGLNNVARHAQASHVSVLIQQDEDGVLLELCDNGQGFVQEGATYGLGLVGMSERVRAIGGTVQVESEVRAGTHLHIRIPLAEARIGGKP